MLSVLKLKCQKSATPRKKSVLFSYFPILFLIFVLASEGVKSVENIRPF